jgi:prepilin-type processing-associated H-X9-DG protein
LIELLTVIAVLGLLASLVLPALSGARASARRLKCANNARQIGVALHEFETAHRKFPGLAFISTTLSPDTSETLNHSPAGKIAASLEGPSFASQISFIQPPHVDDEDWQDSPLPAPAVLHCPDDALSVGKATSYRFSLGVVPEWPRDPGGAFARWYGFEVSEFTDSLSHTAFASERLVSNPARHGHDERRDVLRLFHDSNNDVPRICIEANARNTVRQFPFSTQSSGTSWLSGRWIHGGYVHLFPPNGRWVDCRAEHSNSMAVVTARSNHPGGVTVLLGDGHVRFMANAVSLPLWRALATRAGRESVDLE